MHVFVCRYHLCMWPLVSEFTQCLIQNRCEQISHLSVTDDYKHKQLVKLTVYSE